MANETGSGTLNLGTVIIQSNVAGTVLDFPTELELSIHTSQEGANIGVLAKVALANLQNSFDAIAKTLPMPNDTSGYGTKIVVSVESASLGASGDTAQLAANINVTVWQIEKGMPGGGTTIRWETRCVDLPWPVGKVCFDVPVEIAVPPGPDIKLEVLKEGLNAQVALSLATPDGQAIEIRPGPATVTPRGDLGKFFNDIAGIFNQNLSAQAQREIAEIINDGTLRQALPAEILVYNPKVASVQFQTRLDGTLGAMVDFRATLTPEQLAEWIKKSIGK